MCRAIGSLSMQLESGISQPFLLASSSQFFKDSLCRSINFIWVKKRSLIDSVRGGRCANLLLRDRQSGCCLARRELIV
jgi:hypothetical protein